MHTHPHRHPTQTGQRCAILALLPFLAIAVLAGTYAAYRAQVLEREASTITGRIAESRRERLRRLSAAAEPFPPFGSTVPPVTHVPHWGAMRSPEEWSRTYAQMTEQDFVPLPPYDLAHLGTTLGTLIARQTAEDVAILTEKLTYSTRFFGAYDIDALEFTGTHPGIDLKLALGTPIGAIAGGRVQTVTEDDRLGLSVTIEHRHPRDGTFFSVYGHFDSVTVAEGDGVSPGQTIGRVGKTGKAMSPHLHLQVDRPQGTELGRHVPYHTAAPLTSAEAARFSIHPIRFIERYGLSDELI